MDDPRLTRYVDGFEKFITRILLVMMAAVVVLATVELGWILIKDVLTSPILLLEIHELFEIFGLFLIVLIGIELLHSVKVYLVRREVHLRTVFAVGLIAVARKIIVLDPAKIEHTSLLGIAAVILALTIGYFLVQRAAPEPRTESSEDSS
jgi:uncharacterized membrane protein (DUF373 family)